MAEVLEDLTVDERAMRANLDRTRGLAIPRSVAVSCAQRWASRRRTRFTEKLCATAAREGKTLAEVLRADPQAGKAVMPAALRRVVRPVELSRFRRRR
jgi:adenylosuccinate lyase